ncbi:mTERF domain-containing protein 2 [Toxocara canis]|uniref:mTERF domain-containing protein 2 n=2 Tax=Toxocara canis TaxID=6265 RepID=A0A0B2VMB4_TOXCA|nr:mTERF domain-containing protein 2 [Toxocara canis]
MLQRRFGIALRGCCGRYTSSRRMLLQKIIDDIAPVNLIPSRIIVVRQMGMDTERTQLPCSSKIDEESSTLYARDELIPGPKMLQRITDDLRNKGTTFFLPINDENAMNSIAEPLRNLVRQMGMDTERTQLPCSSKIDEESSTLYARDELIPGPKMLQRITDDLRNKGTTFFLPINDENAMNSIAEPLRNLVNAGVRAEFVIDACVQRPQLLRAFAKRGTVSFELIETLVDSCAMTFEDAVRIFATYTDELLGVEAESVQKRLNVLVGCNIPAGRPLGRAVRKCPAVLFASNPKCMGVVAESLSGFFSRGQISVLVANTPHILLSSTDELEPKYEYIYFHMCIEENEFGTCERWVDMPLEEIMMRHEFLLKTGRYTTPDPKRPQFKMENPVLKRILDTPDANFATEVAGVTQEEWLIFKGLTEKISRQSDMERPFERIKPSMRKAFERRRKEGARKEAHIFDAAANDER